MKRLLFLSAFLLIAQTSAAKLSCLSDEQKLVVDPQHKQLELTKAGVPHRLKILNPANHGFEIFGKTSSAYEVEGGLVVGIKDSKDAKRKDLSVFRRGEVIASFKDCQEM